jgi:F0F1-type ATP synthase delta subunit
LQLDYDIVGSSYANALVEVAQQKNCLEAVHADIDALASVMKDSEVSRIYSI